MRKELEALYRLATRNNGNRRSDEEVDKDFRIVENALTEYEAIKKQEPTKALEIIKEKLVDVEYLSKCNNVKEYNAHWCYENFYLTEEEFNLLKEVLE